MSLIFIASGHLSGSHMVWALVDAGEDVVVVDNLSTGFEWAVAPEAEFIPVDIGDTERLLSIISSRDIEAIIHFCRLRSCA